MKRALARTTAAMDLRTAIVMVSALLATVFLVSLGYIAYNAAPPAAAQLRAPGLAGAHRLQLNTTAGSGMKRHRTTRPSGHVYLRNTTTHAGRRRHPKTV